LDVLEKDFTSNENYIMIKSNETKTRRRDE